MASLVSKVSPLVHYIHHHRMVSRIDRFFAAGEEVSLLWEALFQALGVRKADRNHQVRDDDYRGE